MAHARSRWAPRPTHDPPPSSGPTGWYPHLFRGPLLAAPVPESGVVAATAGFLPATGTGTARSVSTRHAGVHAEA